ncbi:MAG TPA: DUF1080 domain-containing protein [Bryobacteraceae bacterium]|nr:DUF1080 domain-containing protein [Bryobacteraceae bacterium]
MSRPICQIGVVVALCSALPAAAQNNRLTDADRRQGWRLLFDGKSADGWLEITGEAFPTHSWTVEDGCLKALVRTDGFQDIRTADTFRSFDLEFDWKLLRDGNSGVKYLIQRTDEWVNQQGRQARARGLEYQLADDHNSDASSDPTRVTASLYSVFAPARRVEFTIGAFNHSRILVHADHVEHWLNGIQVLEFGIAQPEVNKHLLSLRPNGGSDLPIRRDSPISLQNHSSPAWFRNIRIRPLD